MKSKLILILLILPLSIITTENKINAIQTNAEFTPTFIKANIETFVTPDCSYEAIEKVISIANNTLKIMVYEFWHPKIIQELNKALDKGVRIYLLVEGDTYGSSGDNWNNDTLSQLYNLNQSGKPIEIKIEVTGAYLHTKVIIADNKVVFISSENFMQNSYPATPTHPNVTPYQKPSRGWGVIVYNQEVAQTYSELFDQIYYGASSKYYVPQGGSPPEPKGEVSYSPIVTVKMFNDVLVYPVYTPNNSLDAIKWMISRANYTIYLDLMYISVGSDAVQELISELVKAKNRGVTIHIILEDDFYDYYNSAMEELSKYGFHILKAFYKSEILFLHNKGIIVDDILVLVGSINWSKDALLSNWEAGLLIKSRDVALYYKKVYASDWDKSSNEPFDSDNDGLSDWYEKEHSYNPYNPDTDGDGINDWEEVFVHGNKTGNYQGESMLTKILLIILIIAIIVIIVIIVYQIWGKRGLKKLYREAKKIK